MYQQRLDFWKAHGFEPKVIYDIGANKGEFARDMKRNFPLAHIECFEANEDNQGDLQEFSHHILLLGDTVKENIPFYKIKDGYNTGDSMYLEVSSAFREGNYTTVFKKMSTLDILIKEKNLQIPEFLKLDVQGAELDILRGSEATLPHVKWIQMECSLHRWNAGAPMMEDCFAFMKERGFVPVDILEHHILPGNYLGQVDVLFAHTLIGARKERFDC